MGHDKLAWPLAGVPVLRRALDALLAAEAVTAVVVVCPAARWRLLEGAVFSKPVTRVDGGATRQESVACGLAAVDSNTQWVAVHDAARPLVAADDIARCVAAAVAHGAAALARRATETLQRADAEDFSAGLVDRDHLWCMETPQVFATALLREACAAAAASGLLATDEVSAVQALGARVKFVTPHHPNLKITTPADLALATALLHSTP